MCRPPASACQRRGSPLHVPLIVFAMIQPASPGESTPPPSPGATDAARGRLEWRRPGGPAARRPSPQSDQPARGPRMVDPLAANGPPRDASVPEPRSRASAPPCRRPPPAARPQLKRGANGRGRRGRGRPAPTPAKCECSVDLVQRHNVHRGPHRRWRRLGQRAALLDHGLAGRPAGPRPAPAATAPRCRPRAVRRPIPGRLERRHCVAGREAPKPPPVSSPRLKACGRSD